ncbi:hypothetical protein KHA96_01595 [Bacillus sp. FJAT-49711]|uniref:PilN domain-containing protein n=1 Tax=Bacillus sp. FJAT-49711 TaxID=2833585 RepID=UPI001BCA402F|nr:PilN domain-containing protein [Bacillus sp. FJAT-49711]MBS4217002.1 hypothetical protein [Bacillus sp. FJAT-49711]
MIEINLIPPRKKKSYFLLVSLLTIFGVAICVSTIILVQLQFEKEHVRSLEKQSQQIQELIEIEKSKLTNSQLTSSTEILNNIIVEVDKKQIDSVPILSQLISLLPERGFFESLTYSLNGDIQLTVQFDSSREAAYYLNALLHSPWLNKASLASITAKEETEEGHPIENEKILPRYTAIYQLFVDKKYITDLQVEGGKQ